MSDGVIQSQPIYSRTSIEAERGMVASGHEKGAAAGAAVIAQGGNAVDALLAGAFAGMVAEPSSCGLGGWAQISVWSAAKQEAPDRRRCTHLADRPGGRVT